MATGLVVGADRGHLRRSRPPRISRS